MSKRFDDHVEMPQEVDDYLYQILQPTCGTLTFACVDVAWNAVVRFLVEREVMPAATLATREAARR